MILGETEYISLIDEITFGDLQTATCMNCNNAFLFESGVAQGNIKDDMGNILAKYTFPLLILLRIP